MLKENCWKNILIDLGKEWGTAFCFQIGDFRVQNLERYTFMKHSHTAVCKEEKNPADQNAVLFLSCINLHINKDCFL